MEGCWEYDCHARPSFSSILQSLDTLAHSTFNSLPGTHISLQRIRHFVENKNIIQSYYFEISVRRRGGVFLFNVNVNVSPHTNLFLFSTVSTIFSTN